MLPRRRNRALHELRKVADPVAIAYDPKEIEKKADDLLKGFIAPRLWDRVKKSCSISPHETMRFRRFHRSHYLFQVGEYETFVPSSIIINEAIIKVALERAPQHNLIPDPQTNSFSMVIE